MTENHTHCQCDNCSGIDCGQNDPEAYAAAEKQRTDKIRIDAREELLDEIEFMMEDGIHYTDYSGNTISLPVERWEEIINELRSIKVRS